VLTVTSLVLFVLIAAHVAHLPVLAHEGRDRTSEQVLSDHAHGHASLNQASGHAAAAPADGPHAASSDHGQHDSRLAGRDVDSLECMATAATIPTRAAISDFLMLPPDLPDTTPARSSASETAVIVPADPVRRHLLLQVLQR